MIKIFFILLLPFILSASKILSYNVYDRTDRADIMMTFDTPFNGVVKQYRSKTKIVLKLENVTIESTKSKTVSSKFLQKFSIVPLHNAIQITATVPSSDIKISASKTIDSYGLRLRFSTKSPVIRKATSQVQTPLSNLPTKKGDDLSKSYYIVIAILIIGIFILFYIKNKITPKTNTPKKTKKGSWLFEANKKDLEPTKEIKKNNEAKVNSVEIRFQKAINSENSIVMLDFGVQSYLVLMGKSNILLDKFTDEKPTSQQEFEEILQSRHEELDTFLSTPTNSTSNTKEEPLQAYKERAAALLYNDTQN